MSPPLISIVTVVLNAAPTLERTILSVLNQDFSDYEYFIIDGGSTDGSLEIIERYQERLTGWESAPDNGISEAFNRGLERVRGKWVGFINADDWYEPGAFREVASKAGESDIFYGPIRYWERETPKEWYDANHQYLNREMTLNHPATFVRKKVYEQLGGFNPDFQYAMDYEFLLRCHMAGMTFQKTGFTLANISYGGISDNFNEAYKEVYQAKISAGIHPFKARQYYYFQLLRRHIRNWLGKYGGRAFIDRYRRSGLSPIKKY